MPDGTIIEVEMTLVVRLVVPQTDPDKAEAYVDTLDFREIVEHGFIEDGSQIDSITALSHDM